MRLARLPDRSEPTLRPPKSSQRSHSSLGGPRLDRLSDYDYELPPDRIAQVPLADRSASKLLVLDRRTGHVRHRRFTDVPDILREGDLLVFNDTRVTALRLKGRKPSGGEVEALLLKRKEPGIYTAMVKPARRLKPGARIEFEGGLGANVATTSAEGLRDLQFDSLPDLAERLNTVGRVPLPPYIEREIADPERYQTVYAAKPGSAAAPTAGLHFTRELITRLKDQGVHTATVTVDVGIDTFRPVQVEELDEHKMHGERIQVSEETADEVARCRGRVFAVGTTSIRALETMATGKRRLRVGEEISRLFIRPGFDFHIVDALFTNFHLPKTTMLVLVSSLVRREWLMSAYSEAIQHNYRFLSFGDSMLLV